MDSALTSKGAQFKSRFPPAQKRSLKEDKWDSISEKALTSIDTDRDSTSRMHKVDSSRSKANQKKTKPAALVQKKATPPKEDNEDNSSCNNSSLSEWSSSIWTRGDLGASPSTWSRSDPELLVSESSPSTWTRSDPELCLTLSEELYNYDFDLWRFFWPDKSGFVNVQSCRKLIATNLNVHLICAGAVCSR